jgi:hypothetical protein
MQKKSIEFEAPAAVSPGVGLAVEMRLAEVESEMDAGATPAYVGERGESDHGS